MNLRLKFAILERFLRQADFCREAGLREDRLSRIINGRSDPTETERRLIIEKLGVPENDIFAAAN
jgi:transcriptional regulator with XRE-family HTH domain